MSDKKPKPKLPELDVDAHMMSPPADEPPERLVTDDDNDEPDVELHGQFFNRP